MAPRILTHSAAETLSTTRTEHDALGAAASSCRSPSVIASSWVMRDADRPDVERPLQRFKLDPRLDAQLGVDFRQRRRAETAAAHV